jgi:hypothetical protein
VEPRAESDLLHARVRAFASAALRGETRERFDDLALTLARFQAAHVPAFGRLCRARGVDLGAATSADEIPALPCDIFRLARIAVHPPSEDERVFHTSGTTQGSASRGEHAMRTTATYAQVALAWGERLLWPDRSDLRPLVLAPSLAEVPDSSLGFMLDLFASHLGGAPSFHVRDGALDLEGISRAAADARATGRPVLLLGTSFAFVHLLDASAGLDLRLPPGSRAMQTGGFKGRSREVAPDELRRAIATAFALPEMHVVGEYGMTELSSQLYEGTLAAALGLRRDGRHGVYLAPPWVRVSAADPESLRVLPAGEAGILRIVDLANVDSAVAIQTSDLGRVTDEGVLLLGRAKGATPRGCSLAIDDLLGAGRG